MSRYYRPEFAHLSGIERIRKVTPPNVRMRLNRLERPEPWPYGDLQQYPDYQPFIDRLANFVGVHSDQIVLGLGSEDLIRASMLLACGIGQGSANVLWPTCAMYEIHAKTLGVQLTKINPNPKRGLSLERLLKAIDASYCDVFYLVNPGQPVETYYPLQDLKIIAKRCADQQILLVVDEAYYGFGAESARPLIDQFDNVLILRTFSKAWGLAGLRVGYALGCPDLIKPLDAIRLSGEVTGPSINFISWLLEHYEEEVVPYMAGVADSRKFSRMFMQQLGLWADGQYGNHVLVDLGQKRKEWIGKRLEERGIYINWNLPKPLEDYAMITCGSVKLMMEFAVEFEEVFNEHRRVRISEEG